MNSAMCKGNGEWDGGPGNRKRRGREHRAESDPKGGDHVGMQDVVPEMEVFDGYGDLVGVGDVFGLGGSGGGDDGDEPFVSLF